MGIKLRPPLHKHSFFFFFFLNSIGREHKNAFETSNSPLLLSAFLGGGNLVFRRFSGSGVQNHEMLELNRSAGRVNPG